MKKILRSILALTLLGNALTAQNITIPDAQFKAFLIGHALNTNDDSEISVAEAEAFTGRLSCFNKNIADLTGIEAFTALTELSCSANQLTSINLSKNTALVKLSCTQNEITSLDVSKNVALTTLDCGDNLLTTLDLSTNTLLEVLECDDNQLTQLDVTNNVALQKINCFRNQLSTSHQLIRYFMSAFFRYIPFKNKSVAELCTYF